MSSMVGEQGYNPDALLPTVETIQVPVPADFLEVGDFNVDGLKDFLVGGRLGGLFLIAGDGNSGWLPAQLIELPGNLTALAAGEFRAADGKRDVALGISGPGGSQLFIYDGAKGGVTESPMQFQLASEASVIRFGGIDGDAFIDAVVGTDGDLTIIHGWGRQQTPALDSRIEHISAAANIRGLSLGHYVWDREGRLEIATLSGDGTLQLIEREGLDTRKFTESELLTRNRGNFRPQVTQAARQVDLEALPSWNQASKVGWTTARSIHTNAITRANPNSLLTKTNMASRETDELVIAGSEMTIVRQIDPQSDAETRSDSPTASVSGDLALMSFESTSAPVAVLQLPNKINGERTMVVMQEGATSVSLLPLAPATISVDRFDDPDPGAPLQAADNCTAALSDCSLRGAIEFANLALAADQPTTINLPAGTYTLDNNGTSIAGCDNNPVGDLTINGSVAMVGLGGGATIQQLATGVSNDGDRVMCLNLAFAINKTYNFSNLTIVGGRDGSFPGAASVLGGGGIIGGELDNVTTLTNVTLANNHVYGFAMGGGNANLGGGGIQITGGDLTITNCTIGGASAPGTYADRTATTTANLESLGSGGGVTYTPSSPMHKDGTGDMVVTGTTFSRNTATGIGGGGADTLIFAFGAPGGFATGGSASFSTCTFTQNVGSSGGAIIVESLPTTVATTALNNNNATNRGGGIYVGGSVQGLTLNGTGPAITFTGNTATNGGSSVSTATLVTVQGTNTTIGGDIEIGTGGNWTNSPGSTLAPTNVVVVGGAVNINNSTMNVGGNFTFGPGAVVGATFNGGTGTVNIPGNLTTNSGGTGPVTSFNGNTGTFNFNGSGSQTISGTLAPTFGNLTDSNITQPLTLNNSFAVNGTLNVNGPNAILAPVAAAVISGATGTLTGTGRVRVTRTTGVDNFFNQYSMPTRTLTNLTVEYIGAAAQTASVTTYSNLIINNGSGVSLGAGTTTVNNTLTLQAGALGVGTSTLVINNGTTVVGGSITSSPTGTVNYNQSSAGQDVRAFNYGNLTFSAFTKVLASSGTIGISGTFNPNGVTSGHTITGSTINFNGAGAQTIPAFNYNNLTSSSTGARTLANAGTIGIAGVFTPGTNVYTITGSTIDFNGSGAQTISAFNYNNLTSSNTGTRTLAGAGTIGIFSVFTPGTNSYTITGSTVNFNGTGAQTVNAFNYNSLTISGARTTNSVTLASGTIGVAAIFSPTASFTTGNYITTGNTIDFNGSIPQAIPAFNYNNLTSSNVGARTLANAGTIGIAAVFTPGTNTYTITGSTIDFNGSGAQNIPAFNYNNLTSSNTGTRTLPNGGTVGIAGVFTPGTNVYTITGSTVVYNGGSPQTMPATFTTYNNLTLNNPNGVTGFAGLTVQGLLRVQAGTFTSSSQYNNVQIDVGATMAATAASTINVSGNWTNNGTFTSNTGTVVFNGNNNTQTLTGTTTFNNLTINHTGTGNVISSGTTNVNALGTSLLRVQGGTFIIGAGNLVNVQIDSGQTLQGTNATTLNVTGNWTNNSGTFTPSGNTVSFNGGAAQSIGGTAATQTFDNFTVAKTGGTTLSVAASTTALDINGNVTLTTGIFAAGTAATINVAGNWTNNATFTGGSGTVIFDGANNTQTLAGNTTFNNLTSNHTGTGNVNAAGSTLTVTGLMRVQGGTFISSSTFNNVQIDSGATLEGTNATTMNVAGNWTNDGGTFTPNGNTVNFNGSGAQLIGGTAAAQTFNNFIVNKSAGALTVGGSTTSITTNNLTMTLGSFTAPATLDINGNALLSAGTLTSGANITVAGNWTNNGGTFNGGTGTVTFDGGVGQTIGGTTATTFFSLTNGNANGLAMANDNTVNGNLGLSSADITVAATRTLTQPVAGTSSGAFDVNGRLLRTGFVTGGAALSFGNPLNTIQVTAGTAPANILVDLTRSVPTGVQGFPTAVQRTYTITPSAAGFTGTLRLRYLESELNGNVEGPDFIFRRFTLGIGWVPVLPTSSDFTNNWLEATGVTQFSPWTFNSTAAPTAADGVITGRITDSNGAPVEGAVVRLQGTQNRKFITDSNGFYRFDKVETNGFYTVTPSRANYSFNPAVRSFSQVGQATEAAFGAVVASSGFVNPLDTPEYFVRQHYLDFLGREPDEAGFNFWSDEIIGCGADLACSGRKRENVSAAYFLSIEFQATGGLVDGLYRASYGARPQFSQFMPDTLALAAGVVVGKDGWQAKLQANKEAFIAAFVNRPAFHALYDGMNNSQFVDTMISNTGVSFTASEREALIGMTRAEALSTIAENGGFKSARFNDAFVMMEYFGYLRRDADAEGFQYWLNKLNQFGGNFEQAEMVRAFIVSGEYRDRFPK